ncbi:hypothetical protein K7432_011794 [Basidiobolus ranarum]|uniref:BZIP domain-containing protein n=1 Tax=Basidiobolus ranarum TaxID=34480 RepID=A0ABR2VTP0_9FUNG
MSLTAFPIESAIPNTAKVSSSVHYMNTSTTCETAQFFPSLEGLAVSAPTPEEIEQLSFFDEWLANDYNGVATQSCSKLIHPIGDFEITPISDPFSLPMDSLDIFNASLIDDSMLSSFPSPECMSHMGFLSEMSTGDISALSYDSLTSPTYVNYASQQPSPVNIQLPSPAQTPRASPLLSKHISQDSFTQVASTVSESNKRSHSDENVTDETATKRKRNTDAARRSRQRKTEKLNELDKRTSELLTENTQLSTKVAILESEKKYQRQKELELQIRIQTLENQLAEAHRILTDQ